ncbi:hypothetical protein [uncultured Gimesia sp.]|jgi:hypothetical protein|uniref:hypothetical protein n=1 Tax=uncultured Gimesia sp. TaxID=1678688 RepID=UPI00261A0ACD|nr:hypothetical protein [uncultured Gimesia sp.]
MKWFDVRYVRNYSGKKAISFFQKGPQNSEKTNAAACRRSKKSGATLRPLTPEKDEIFLFFQRVKSTAAADKRNFADHVRRIRHVSREAAGWKFHATRFRSGNREIFRFLFENNLYFVYNIRSSGSGVLFTVAKRSVFFLTDKGTFRESTTVPRIRFELFACLFSVLFF